MADTTIAVVDTPVWVDLQTSEPAASRVFYARLFGWTIEINPDPQDGGHAPAKIPAPMDFPGGRFVIVGDPRGAIFGLHMLSGGHA